jgi:uncharacterized protein YfaS (alpha-2-macroglobulin family)
MLLAARAGIKEADKTQLAVNGTPTEGAVNKSYDADSLTGSPVEIVNRGGLPADAAVTITGVPLTPEPAGGKGFSIARAYYHTDGTPADVATVGQNERLIVAVTVKSAEALTGRLLVVDRLPAGFEIENPNLDEGDTTLRMVSRTPISHTGRGRTASSRRSAATPAIHSISGAYSVRAVSPGVFMQPAATVEDMYRPERRARTGFGKVEVVGLTR